MHKTEGDANVSNRFDEGDPGVPRLPTQIDATWLNAVQDEIRNVIEGAGITLKTQSTETGDQLLAALAKLFLEPGAAPAYGAALPDSQALVTARTSESGATKGSRQRIIFKPNVNTGNGAEIWLTVNASYSIAGAQWASDNTAADSTALRIWSGAPSPAPIGPMSNTAGVQRLFRAAGAGNWFDNSWSPVANVPTGLSYGAHWADKGAPHPAGQWTLSDDGQVRLMGACLNDGTSGQVATLPSSVRPAQTCIFPAAILRSGASDYEFCTVQIDTAGAVTVQVTSPGSMLSALLILNGICFTLASI